MNRSGPTHHRGRRSRWRQPVMRTATALLAAVGLTVTLAGTAGADPGPVLEPTPVNPEWIGSPNSQADISALTLPPIPEDMSSLASELTGRFANNPQFASAEVTPQRDRIVVHWHGRPSAPLLSLTGATPGVSTEIRQTRFQPGLLRAATQKIFGYHSAIKSAGIRHDGSGLIVSVDPAAFPGSRPSQSELQAVTGYPTLVNFSAPAAASTRQYDFSYHLGGARLYFFSPTGLSSCTAGFPVTQNSDPTNQGMMFAAHCGISQLGDDWNVLEPPARDRGYKWGETVAFDYYHDGAIIDSGFSQPYMWIGDYQATTYARVNGARNAFRGQELCYSGSFSGLVCGNIVQETNVSYTMGGYPSPVVGFITNNQLGNKAAGNGDSGGPGYELTYDTGTNTYKRYAVGIISAIPANSGTECAGVPGDPAPDGRKCSETVFAGSVVQIMNDTGWSVREQ